MSLTMEYRDDRGTWNVFDAETKEWIYEGTYEQCEKMLNDSYDLEAEELSREAEGYNSYDTGCENEEYDEYDEYDDR